MTERVDGQLCLPVEISQTFDSDGAAALNRLAEIFGIEPNTLALYGLGAIVALQNMTEARGQQCYLYLGTDYNDPGIMRLELPQVWHKNRTS